MARHSDDEPFFGECGEAKLIVSVSFRTGALCKWKGKSCPDCAASSCWLGHGDLLIMDGQSQDEFCALYGIEQHVASCAVLKSGVMCCLVRRVHPVLLRSLWEVVHFGVLC